MNCCPISFFQKLDNRLAVVPFSILIIAPTWFAHFLSLFHTSYSRPLSSWYGNGSTSISATCYTGTQRHECCTRCTAFSTGFSVRRTVRTRSSSSHACTSKFLILCECAVRCLFCLFRTAEENTENTIERSGERGASWH